MAQEVNIVSTWDGTVLGNVRVNASGMAVGSNKAVQKIIKETFVPDLDRGGLPAEPKDGPIYLDALLDGLRGGLQAVPVR